MKNLSVNDVLADLPTLSRAFVTFAESLEPLPLDELVQVVKDRNTQDILIAAANFKAAMAQVLQRRALLH
ncbi:hypothetical protein LCGC14_0244280 [marine sediment metagenome]|uniref:Uncharacterized protein n=1 Tax=marine sediment metagenome TaxID=412755 RepID=A0A0F9WRH1_9ZZZZ